MLFRQPLKISALAFSFAASALLSSCGSGSDSPKNKDTVQVVDADVSEYAKASCVYDYNQGAMALTKTMPDIQVSHFGKKYDTALLKPVLGASGAEVVHFAETTGVRFYKTSAYKNSESCFFLTSLPSAPSDLEGEFRRASKDSDILGLYLNAQTPNLDSTDFEAAITVRKDGNKWVLVHEYMHHLFQIQAKADGIDVTKLKEKIGQESTEVENDMKSIGRRIGDDRKTAINATAVKLNTLSVDFLTLIKQYMLEEMTIETILGDKLAMGDLKVTHPKQRINGAAYIISSEKNGNRMLNLIKTEISNFQTAYLFDMNTEVSKELDTRNTEIQKLSSEMANLSYKARNFLLSEGLDYKGLTSNLFGLNASGRSPGHFGCSHGQLPEEIIEKMKGITRLRH